MKFSIVTPSFNQLDWLELAIASAADQAGVDIEHIVQDAGSPGIEATAEKTGAALFREGEMIRPANGDRPNYSLSIHVEKDRGMYDAINKGLLKSRGDICSYLNCDEQYLPGTLDTVRRYFSEHPEIDLLFGDALLVDPQGRPLAFRQATMPRRTFLNSHALNVLTCSTFFRRKAIVESGLLFDATWRIIGDKKWVYECLEHAVPTSVLNRLLATFTLTGNNLASSPQARDERALWNRDHSQSKISSMSARLLHVAQKLASGAYRKRNVEYMIFASQSRGKRVAFSANQLPTHWPRE